MSSYNCCRLPTDPFQKDKWLSFIFSNSSTSQEKLPNKVFLCSFHFEKKCYEQISENKFRLKKNAIPTIPHRYSERFSKTPNSEELPIEVQNSNCYNKEEVVISDEGESIEDIASEVALLGGKLECLTSFTVEICKLKEKIAEQTITIQRLKSALKQKGFLWKKNVYAVKR